MFIKLSSIFIVLLLISCNTVTIHASTQQLNHSFFTAISTTDKLINHGTSNISAGYHKILPSVSRHQLLESNIFTFSNIQAALGSGQIIAGTVQIAIGITLQKIQNNPKEAMASVIIPAIIHCMFSMQDLQDE